MLGVLLAVVLVAMVALAPNPAEAQSGTWHNSDYGWWYQRSDGSYPQNQWEYINGNWYLFNEDGYANCGDYVCAGNAWYAFNWDCSMCQGWFWDTGYQNYFYAQPGSGYLHCNCWSWISGHWYGFNADCQMTRGWSQGWDGTWYYCAPYAGSQTNSGYWYPEGCMYWSDWAWIDGYCYYFWGNGAMATNCWVDGSWVDENGHWISGEDPADPVDPVDPQEVINLVNAVRVEHGLSPVIPDDTLTYLANLRCIDMAEHHILTHDTPTYGRLEKMLKDYKIPNEGGGEDIAQNVYTPQAVFDAWMSSPPHRAIIANPWYNRVGIGYYKLGNDVYWALVFLEINC